MKKLNVFFVLGLFITLVAFQNANVASYKVNTEYSTVNWTGFKIGGQHTGVLKLKEGTLNFEEGKLSGGQFIVDMATLTCTDLEDAEQNKKLVGHLKSADFFNIEEHPTAKYVITKTIPYGSEEMKEQGYTKDTYKLVGEMTIKGITKPFKTQVEIYNYDTSISAVGRITVDRSDFDVRYGSGSFFDDLGDKIIYDDIQLDLNISASPGAK